MKLGRQRCRFASATVNKECEKVLCVIRSAKPRGLLAAMRSIDKRECGKIRRRSSDSSREHTTSIPVVRVNRAPALSAAA